VHCTRQPTRHDLGAVVRAFRLRTDLSQERLEQASRLPHCVSSVERGERTPSFEVIARRQAAVEATWREFGEALDRQVKRG
jgi:hypothetical protein